MSRVPPELIPEITKGAGPLAHLSQEDAIADIDQLGRGEWTVLYRYESGRWGSHCFYSALLQPDKIADSLKEPSWDISIGDGFPSFTKTWDAETEVVTYDRFGMWRTEPKYFQ